MFTLSISIRADDIDDLGHVHNVVYLRWVIDVARAHWDTLAAPADLQRLGWVVTRHELDYKAAALPGDSIVARTWIGETSPITCERFVEIRRAEDDRLLVKARSMWVPVDRATGRPKRIAEEVLAPLRESDAPTD